MLYMLCKGLEACPEVYVYGSWPGPLGQVQEMEY